MRHKNNPWVALVALLLLIVVCVCTGCSNTSDSTTATEAETWSPRFTIERASELSPVRIKAYIITDTETGVQYLYVGQSSRAGGLTKLEPAQEAPEK